MTIERFISRHGKEWGILKDDLIAFIDSKSPAHDADRLPIAVAKEQRDTLNHSFSDRLAGFSACRRILSDLGESLAVDDGEEQTFAKSQEQIFAEEHPLPVMPPPKKRRK